MSSPMAQTQLPVIRILLVDGNPSFLRMTERFLHTEDRFAVVGTAHSGEQALILVPQLQPDIAVVDLAMPDLTGLRTISRLRAALPRIGIIALTSLGVNGHEQAMLTIGADRIISKATISTELMPTIQQLVLDKSTAGHQDPSSQERPKPADEP